MGRQLDAISRKEGAFLSLRLLDASQKIVSDNLYWLPDSAGIYSGLQRMGKAALVVEARFDGTRIIVTLHNPAGGPVAFFNRLSLLDPATRKRLLPVFYSDNYLSVLPGESRMVVLEYEPHAGTQPLVSVQGWNVEERVVPIK
jgi:hypothetical protein